jgi:hypothetical protein
LECFFNEIKTAFLSKYMSEKNESIRTTMQPIVDATCRLLSSYPQTHHSEIQENYKTLQGLVNKFNNSLTGRIDSYEKEFRTRLTEILEEKKVACCRLDQTHQTLLADQQQKFKVLFHSQRSIQALISHLNGGPGLSEDGTVRFNGATDAFVVLSENNRQEPRHTGRYPLDVMTLTEREKILITSIEKGTAADPKLNQLPSLGQQLFTARAHGAEFERYLTQQLKVLAELFDDLRKSKTQLCEALKRDMLHPIKTGMTSPAPPVSVSSADLLDLNTPGPSRKRSRSNDSDVMFNSSADIVPPLPNSPKRQRVTPTAEISGIIEEIAPTQDQPPMPPPEIIAASSMMVLSKALPRQSQPILTLQEQWPNGLSLRYKDKVVVIVKRIMINTNISVEELERTKNFLEGLQSPSIATTIIADKSLVCI